MQEPILVFLYYNNPNGTVIKVDYFDLQGTLRSRENITLNTSNGSTANLDEINDLDRECFRIYDTRFYLRVFRLIDNDEKTFFQEVLTRTSKKKRKVLESEVDTENYIRRCLLALFSVERLTRYGSETASDLDDYFVSGFTSWVKKLLTNAKEDMASTRGDGAETDLLMKTRDESIAIKNLWDEFRKHLTSDGNGIDRIYRRFSASARKIKDLAGETMEPGQPNALPNMFWIYKTIDRDVLRAPVVSTVDGDLSGFSYNAHFMLSHHQEEDVSRYLREARRLDRQKRNDVEKFGWWLANGVSKDYFPKESHVANLAKELDSVFWKRFDKSEKQDVKQTNPINLFVAELFRNPFGGGSVSFADQIFQGGLVHFRYPFRRFAGLGRISAINKFIDEGKDVRLKDLSDDDVRDCLRIVAFFYMCRGFGQRIGSRNGYRTKLVSFPVFVMGSVASVMGAVAFENHADEVSDRENSYSRRLSRQASGQWDMVHQFHQSVYVPSVREIRRLYRDLQIRFIRDDLAKNLGQAIWQSFRAENSIDPSTFIEAVEKTSALSANLARIIPYPILEMKLEVVDPALLSTPPVNEIEISFLTYFKIKLSQERNPFFGDGTVRRGANPANLYGLLNLQIARTQINDALSVLLDAMALVASIGEEKKQVTH